MSSGPGQKADQPGASQEGVCEGREPWGEGHWEPSEAGAVAASPTLGPHNRPGGAIHRGPLYSSFVRLPVGASHLPMGKPA